MKYRTKAWQKFVFYLGVSSFVIAIACLLFVYLKGDDLGWESTVTASILASSFFFASMGLVLVVIGKTNLPSFKVD